MDGFTAITVRDKNLNHQHICDLIKCGNKVHYLLIIVKQNFL